MTDSLRFVRQTSQILSIVTPALALVVAFVVGFVVGLVGLIQHLMVPEKPWHIGWAMAIGFAVLLPAIWLVWFYLRMAKGTPSLRGAIFGWGISSAYYAGLTWIFIFAMPGSVHVSGSPPFGTVMQMPMAFISGGGLGVSLALLVKYVRMRPAAVAS